ncbi:hypothetical protein ACN28I_41445 [Archangium gephyra]|uniref:hypothetical protein n=1 Tax=Archangium gephyra TaxID=48 RepID=UPI003B829981
MLFTITNQGERVSRSGMVRVGSSSQDWAAGADWVTGEPVSSSASERSCSRRRSTSARDTTRVLSSTSSGGPSTEMTFWQFLQRTLTVLPRTLSSAMEYRR